MIWSKATSYTICKNCISERDSQRKPDKSSYVGPEDPETSLDFTFRQNSNAFRPLLGRLSREGVSLVSTQLTSQHLKPVGITLISLMS